MKHVALNTAVGHPSELNSTGNHTMQFDASTTIQAPAAKVFGIYANVTDWPQWDPDVKSASLQGSFASGAVGEVVPHGGPKSVLKFTAVVPNRLIRMQCKLPLGMMQFDYELLAQGDTTVVTHRTTFSGLLAPLWGRLIGASMKKSLPAALSGLKTHAESH